MLVRSPSGTGAGRVELSLNAGSLSPVSDDSATLSEAAWSRRPSAPTASPSSRTTMSPGTISSAGMRTGWPSRSSVAWGAAIRCNAATACSALRSWTKPSTALATTITAITTASNGTPLVPSSAHATTEIPMAASSR
jgi:hypothetical protein